jgi:hypothetical protein
METYVIACIRVAALNLISYECPELERVREGRTNSSALERESSYEASQSQSSHRNRPHPYRADEIRSNKTRSYRGSSSVSGPTEMLIPERSFSAASSSSFPSPLFHKAIRTTNRISVSLISHHHQVMLQSSRCHIADRLGRRCSFHSFQTLAPRDPTLSHIRRVPSTRIPFFPFRPSHESPQTPRGVSTPHCPKGPAQSKSTGPAIGMSSAPIRQLGMLSITSLSLQQKMWLISAL